MENPLKYRTNFNHGLTDTRFFNLGESKTHLIRLIAEQTLPNSSNCRARNYIILVIAEKALPDSCNN